MKKLLLSSLAVISMLTTVTIVPEVQELSVNAAGYTYNEDGYITISGGSIYWTDFFATPQFSLYNGQADFILFEGSLGSWEHDMTSYVFAQNGSVTISDLISHGVIPATGDWFIDITYILDGGYGGEAYLGMPTAYSTPDYIDTWVGIVNSSEANRIVSYATKPTRASILADLRAYDLEDGDVTLSITETTSAAEKTAYDTLSRGLGTYNLTFQASDTSDNIANVTIHITVTDTIVPVISGPETITTPLSTDVTLANLISQNWSASDAFAGALSITVQSDNYTSNMNVVNSGTGHSVVLRATDPSGNITNKTVYIKVLDDVKPVITGTASYSKGMSGTLTLSTIQSALTVDGTGTSATIAVVSDNYSSNSAHKGTFMIQFQATDAASNTSDIFVVTVTVTDTNAPIFFVDGAVYTVDPGNVYTLDQLINVLESDGTIDNTQDYSYEVVLDEYSDQASIAGSHKIVLNIKYASGATEQVEMNIEVPEAPIVEVPWYESVWSSIKEAFVNFWNSIFGG